MHNHHIDWFALVLLLTLSICLGVVGFFLAWMLFTPRFSPPDDATSLNMILRYCQDTSQLPLAIGSRFSPGQFLACLQYYGWKVTQ